MPYRIRSLLTAIVALSMAPWSAAQCTRPLQVPVAPIGLSITTQGEVVGGAYADVLRSIAGKDGCQIEFSVVPRARLEIMYETGRLDLLVPATRTPRRDEHGLFVPMVSSRAMLVSMQERAPARSLTELLELPNQRVVIVRGFDYGDNYQTMVKALTQQGRLHQAVDAISAARMLAGGMADVTVMSPVIMIGALHGEPKLKPLLERLRYDAVDELPWGESGIYISTKSGLGDADRALVRELLERSVRAGTVQRAFQQHYPAGSFGDWLRPRAQ